MLDSIVYLVILKENVSLKFFTLFSWLPNLLKRTSAMHATESGFFAVDNFSVSSLVNLAATVGADMEAWFNGN